MNKFTAPSGADILITPAPWQHAKELKKAIERELRLGSGLDLMSPQFWIQNILALDGSDMVEAALYPCLKVCTRNNAKIEISTFDDLEARRDYLDIVQACIKENIGPLVESLFSRWTEFLAKQADSQKSVQE